jgi:hypothetical protein
MEVWHYWEASNYFAGQPIAIKKNVFQWMIGSGFGFHIHLGPGFGDVFSTHWAMVPKTWTHVAVTVDQGDGITPPVGGVRLYVNGQLANPPGLSLMPMTASQIYNLNLDDGLRIAGRWGYSLGNVPISWFDGALDDLTIYTRALTGAEINAIYEAGCSGKCYNGPQWTAADYGTAPPLCDPDTLAPAISLCGQTQNFTGCEVPDEPPDLQVTDDCDEVPMVYVTGPTVVTTIDTKDGPSLIAPPGLFSYLVEGTDASGNQTDCTMYVQFTDSSPEITCPDSVGIDLGSECTGTPPSASANDACDPALPAIEMTPSVLTPGFETVTYSVTNQANKTASCTTDYQVVSDSACPVDCTGTFCEE